MKQNIKHIIAGLLSFIVGWPVYQLAYDAETDTHYLAAALWATILSGILLAACKEWCDNNTDGNAWDWKDFGYTCIGVAVAMVLIIVFHFAKG